MQSILTRTVLAIMAVTVVLLVVETTLPIRTTENMVFSYKHTMLMGEAETIASSLNTYHDLSREETQEVMSVLGTLELSQIVVTDDMGRVLYSTNESVTPLGKLALYPEIVSALNGNDAFKCLMTGNAFESYGAIPILCGGVLTGCVYVVEFDREQAALLKRLQSNSITMSVMIILIGFLLYILFCGLIVRKNEKILQSIRIVQTGDYAHRVDVKGKSEFSVLANEFNALTDRLQRTEETRRQFVSDASHELRTPLSAIRLLSDSILQNDMDIDTIREFVQDISGEADRLTRMTSKLLNLTALDSKQFTYQENEVVDLGQCCKKAVRMLSPLAAEKGATIEESSEQNCCVLAREDDIFQLVLNLSENGVKYSKDGGNVRLIAYAKNNMAVLIVEDNGIGIPENELDRIFERFYRVDKARSREAGGAGLGLAIVKETVEKFSGTVTATNRAQGGARFTVTFPLYRWEGEP